MATAHQLIVVADPDALAKAAFERLTARIAANDGRIAICLAGGSSPKKLYELLATDDLHPIPTEVARANVAAACYEQELQAFYGADILDPPRPLFDLVLMGVGSDGHTASLFPDHPALRETERWVIGVPQADVELFVPRVTPTLPALVCCGEMLFEVAGAKRRPILTRLLAGENLPANRALPWQHCLADRLWRAAGEFS